MTGYTTTAVWSGSGTSPTDGTYIRSMALRAGSYAVKIVNVQMFGTGYVSGSGGGSWSGSTIGVNFNHYISSTISGATSVTPQSLREGVAPASATCRYSTGSSSSPTFTPGTSVTVSGTALAMGFQPLTGGLATYQPSSDIIIAPGSVFQVAPFDHANGASQTLYAVMFSLVIAFDELHLARSV